MNRTTYVKKVPLFKSIFGVSSFLFGIITFGFGMYLVGLFICGLSLSMLTTQGVQFDFATKRYRKLKSVVGIHFGQWQPFPVFEYISVFRTSEKRSVTVVTATTTSSSGTILLNLFYTGNKYLTVYRTTDKTEAFKVADYFRKA